MFLGTYRFGFSGAGRVVLPRKLRGELRNAQEIVLTRGLDGGIWGFDKEEWEKQAKLQLEIPITERRGRELRRIFFSGASFAELDKQGRFVIPDELFSLGERKDEVCVVGAGDHFEVWNLKEWKNLLTKGVDAAQ
jgi:MraZ protein